MVIFNLANIVEEIFPIDRYDEGESKSTLSSAFWSIGDISGGL